MYMYNTRGHELRKRPSNINVLVNVQSATRNVPKLHTVHGNHAKFIS